MEMSKNKQTKAQMTVYDATYKLLRSLGLTTFFGNPGSTEQPFLKNFPKDFQYVLGLQEASVVAMADGFSQATNRPVLVNLHSAAGTGNGMCNIMTAYQNKTPLIITAGQQTREMVLGEPYLTNHDETMLPRPWVKWAYQPVRAQDVPAAFMRAYAIAMQPPSGPVYVSIPLDDWDQRRMAMLLYERLVHAMHRTRNASCCLLKEFARARIRRWSTARRSIAVVAGTWASNSRSSSRLLFSYLRCRIGLPFPRRIRSSGVRYPWPSAL